MELVHELWCTELRADRAFTTVTGGYRIGLGRVARQGSITPVQISLVLLNCSVWCGRLGCDARFCEITWK